MWDGSLINAKVHTWEEEALTRHQCGWGAALRMSTKSWQVELSNLLQPHCEQRVDRSSWLPPIFLYRNPSSTTPQNAEQMQCTSHSWDKQLLSSFSHYNCKGIENELSAQCKLSVHFQQTKAELCKALGKQGCCNLRWQAVCIRAIVVNVWGFFSPPSNMSVFQAEYFKNQGCLWSYLAGLEWTLISLLLLWSKPSGFLMGNKVTGLKEQYDNYKS